MTHPLGVLVVSVLVAIVLAAGLVSAAGQPKTDGAPTVLRQGHPDPIFLRPDPMLGLEPPAPAEPQRAAPQAVRPINPTAPNVYTQYLRGDFTDSDGDGMTDVAEQKYGFDHTDPDSFPKRPPFQSLQSVAIPGPGNNLAYTTNGTGIVLQWDNPQSGSYSLRLMNGATQLIYGGHQSESARVDYAVYGLQGTETLTGIFSEYDAQSQWVQDLPPFSLDLSDIQLPEAGAADNAISFTFSGFPEDAKQQYIAFLNRLWPLLQAYLGPPAESFNTVITNMGETTGYFMITDRGRTFLTDASFIPRLIAHEFVHAWKGSFLFTSDQFWNYDPLLTGFEEATAEGMAFVLMHEYVRAYPDDDATIALLSYRPYQYWGSHTIDYDAVRFGRCTAGEFWDPNGLQALKYPIAATTWQMMVLENPDAYRQVLGDYYGQIRADPAFRPTRAELLELWAARVPSVLGIDLATFLGAMPVFDESAYDEGAVVLGVVRPYGTDGDQQFAVTWANKDGKAWWGILKSEFEAYDIPDWVRWMDSDPPDNYAYINTQGEPFTAQVTDSRRRTRLSVPSTTDVYTDGSLGYGWKMVPEVAMAAFPFGLYKNILCFDDFRPHDGNACEAFPFFGLDGFTQDKVNDYVIMVGVDGWRPASVRIVMEGQTYTAPVTNGVALFRSTVWPLDLEEIIDITVVDASGAQQTYKRALLEAGTYWEYFQHQFIISDRDFDGVEDMYEIQDKGVPTDALRFSSHGGQDLVQVQVSEDTSWTATSDAGWLQVLSGAAGEGDGAVVLQALPNTGGPRTATAHIAGVPVTVSQAGAPGAAHLNLLLDDE